MAEARGGFNGQENKCAELVEHVLVYNGQKQFWVIRCGRLSKRKPKNGQTNRKTLRPHRYHSTEPRAKTLLIFIKANIILLKMSGGSTCLRLHGRELHSTKKITRTFEQDCICHIKFVKIISTNKYLWMGWMRDKY